jgi:hypothetical protein
MARTIKVPTGIALHLPPQTVVEIDGVKFDLGVLYEAVRQPNADALFAFKRNGNTLAVTKIENSDQAIEFLIAATRRKRQCQPLPRKVK